MSNFFHEIAWWDETHKQVVIGEGMVRKIQSKLKRDESKTIDLMNTSI